jgi:hypothetical protein
MIHYEAICCVNFVTEILTLDCLHLMQQKCHYRHSIEKVYTLPTWLMMPSVWKWDAWVSVQCCYFFLWTGIDSVMTERGNTVPSHVTLITELTLTRSRCNFNEHMNYYVRNYQMREASKWKSACCTIIMEPNVSHFQSCRTYSESSTSLSDWHMMKCKFVGINQQHQNYFPSSSGDFTTGQMNSKCSKIPVALNFV